MRMIVAVLASVMMLAGCGSSDQQEKKKEEPPMKVEDTAFGPLVGTPKKVQDKTDAAAETYRDNLNQRLDEDEGANKKDEPPRD